MIFYHKNITINLRKSVVLNFFLNLLFIGVFYSIKISTKKHVHNTILLTNKQMKIFSKVICELCSVLFENQNTKILRKMLASIDLQQITKLIISRSSTNCFKIVKVKLSTNVRGLIYVY